MYAACIVLKEIHGARNPHIYAGAVSYRIYAAAPLLGHIQGTRERVKLQVL